MTTSSRNQKRITLLLVAIILIADVIGTRNMLSVSRLGLNDFLSRWEGARTYWVEGHSPYSEQAGRNIQQRIFGGPVPEGGDPSLFAYPFYVVFMLAPLVPLAYPLAASIWMVTLEAMLVGMVLLMLNLLRWQPRPGIFLLLVAGALATYPSARGFFLGQPSHLVIFAQALTIWALARGRDNVAGVALFFSTIKPQMGYLFIPFVILWALRYRRFRVLFVFGGVTAAALAASFIFLPSWLTEWLDAVFNYTTYTGNTSANRLLIESYLGLPSFIEGLVNAALYGCALWAAYTVIVLRRSERFLWACALMFTILNLSAPRNGTSHFAVFVTMMMVFYAFVFHQRTQRAGLWTALMVAAVFLVPWLHFFATVEGNAEHLSMGVPIPWVAFIILVLSRRMWWQGPNPFADLAVPGPAPTAEAVMSPEWSPGHAES